MALVICEQCQSDDIHLDGKLLDGRKDVRCGDCGHQWVAGDAVPMVRTLSVFESARRRFPTPAMVDPARAARVDALRSAFLTQAPFQDPEVAPYWARYQQVFSAEGLSACEPQDLKDFANNSIGAHPGNMSVFNDAWNDLGSGAAAERVRDTIEYLLRGPENIPVEDRLTHLVTGHKGMGMTGFRESLLTRVLCIMQPERFIPILTYSGAGTGKRDITETVFGLKMPTQDQVSMQIGRLVFWSNDLLNELLGEHFETRQHASAFLWWAKDHS